jgi:hypothetical protein
MRARAPWILSALLGIALAVSAVFAVWASAGDAPWEKATAVCTPSPAPSQEELEKIACLQGGGEWGYFDASHPGHDWYCGPGSPPCWGCFRAWLR